MARLPRGRGLRQGKEPEVPRAGRPVPARLLGLPQREGASLREHLPAEGPAPLYALPAGGRPHRARALSHHIPRRGAEPPSRQPSRSPQLVRKRGPHDRRRPPRSLARPSHRQAKQTRQRAGGVIALLSISARRCAALSKIAFSKVPSGCSPVKRERPKVEVLKCCSLLFDRL